MLAPSFLAAFVALLLSAPALGLPVRTPMRLRVRGRLRRSRLTDPWA